MMVDRAQEIPTSEPPKEPPAKQRYFFNSIAEVKLPGEHDFRGDVKEGKTTQIGLGPQFLEELDRLLEIKKIHFPSDVYAQAIEALDFSKLTAGKEFDIDLTTAEDAPMTAHKFLAAVLELDFLKKLEAEKSSIQIIHRSYDDPRSAISPRSIFPHYDNEVQIVVDRDDLYIAVDQFAKKTGDVEEDKLTPLYRRMEDSVLKELIRDAKNETEMKPTDKLVFATEWVLLKSLFGAKRLGLIPFKEAA